MLKVLHKVKIQFIISLIYQIKSLMYQLVFFQLKLNNINMQNFTSADYAFADEGEDPISMIEAVEDTIENANLYCIGGEYHE